MLNEKIKHIKQLKNMYQYYKKNSKIEFTIRKHIFLCFKFYFYIIITITHLFAEGKKCAGKCKWD